MKKITVSAPGKLMLFGEHAVIYNHPCIVTAVNQRIRATIEVLDKPQFELDAPDVKVKDYKKAMKNLGQGEIPKGAKFVEIAVKNFVDRFCHPEFISGSSNISNEMLKPAISAGRQVQHDTLGLKVSTKSEFSSQFGFGSSSASTVCVIKALSGLFDIKLTYKEIFDLAYKTVLDIQGRGSGFDIAAAIYGGTLYFFTAGKKIKTLKLKKLPLIIGYSGIKADTVTLINKVKETFADNKERLNKIYEEIDGLVEKARPEIEKENWEKVGELMTKNQKILAGLGVSIDKLDNMISGAVKAGAYGAKLSGAGGGDCMIAFAPQEKRKAVEAAITKSGGDVIKVQSNAQGVIIEL